jgi:hypothetical protein
MPQAWWRPSKRRLALAGAGLLALVLGAALLLPNYPLREADKAAAARALVAWVVEDRPLPGFGERYADPNSMAAMKRIYVACDFLPEGEAVSADPRVQRITPSEGRAIFDKFGWERQTAYLSIELKEATEYAYTFEVTNVFGPLAGHGYRFVVRRKQWGLRVEGKFLWVA